jgi:excisionase family DNA binding protein
MHVRPGSRRPDRPATVSEAAEVLGVSQPTVGAWIEEGVLPTVPGEELRLDRLALADLKRAVDLVRAHSEDRQLLIQVMRVLRDQAALDGAEEGFDDYRAGRVVPLGDLGSEVAELRRQDSKRRC